MNKIRKPLKHKSVPPKSHRLKNHCNNNRYKRSLRRPNQLLLKKSKRLPSKSSKRRRTFGKQKMLSKCSRLMSLATCLTMTIKSRRQPKTPKT